MVQMRKVFFAAAVVMVFGLAGCEKEAGCKCVSTQTYLGGEMAREETVTRTFKEICLKRESHNVMLMMDDTIYADITCEAL